jgi:hypothetical protein
MTAHRLATLLLSLAPVAGCAVTSPPSTDTATATIGPNGGTLSIAGAKLTIPAGALTEDTEITIRPTFDPTPLPPLAEGVGQQFAIEPAGVALAVPATLDVSTDPNMVAYYHQTAADCMVWQRAGSGWTVDAATATGSADVQVSLATLSTIRAGVRLLLRESCVVDAVSCLPCTASGGHCVSQVPTPGPSNNGVKLGTSGDDVYYMTFSVDPTVGPEWSVVRYDLLHFEAAVSSPFQVGETAAFPAFQPPLVDVDGTVWTGFFSMGNVQFGFNGATATVEYDFGQPSSDGIGAAILPSGRFSRISSAQRVDRLAGEYRPPVPWQHGGTTDSFSNFRVNTGPGDDSLWMFDTDYGNNTLVLWDLVDNTPTVITEPAYYTLGQTATVAHDGTTASPSTVAVQGMTANDTNGPIVIVRQGTATTLSPGFPDGALAFDANNQLWIADETAPEVAVYNPVTGGMTMTVLTTAAMGTPAYIAALPVDLISTPLGMVVQTAGGQLLLVK